MTVIPIPFRPKSHGDKNGGNFHISPKFRFYLSCDLHFLRPLFVRSENAVRKVVKSITGLRRGDSFHHNRWNLCGEIKTPFVFNIGEICHHWSRAMTQRSRELQWQVSPRQKKPKRTVAVKCSVTTHAVIDQWARCIPSLQERGTRRHSQWDNVHCTVFCIAVLKFWFYILQRYTLLAVYRSIDTWFIDSCFELL